MPFVGEMDDVLGRVRFLCIRRSRCRHIYSVVTAFFILLNLITYYKLKVCQFYSIV